MIFEACLEKMFKQLELLRFPVKCWYRCGGNSVDNLMEICRLVVVCNCWRVNKNWSASIVAGLFSLRNCGWLVERFFLLSWRCTWGKVRDCLVNSCHHVVAIFWANFLCCLATEDACFSMRITLGVVLIRSLVWTKCVPGHFWSGSPVDLN